MRNVWVLGSGFSASCGLPTLKDLFREMVKYERPVERNVAIIREALELLYPHLKSKDHYDWYPPLEEFLSLVEVSKQFEDDIENGGTGLFNRGGWNAV